MEWLKSITIVFDTKEPREMLGAHNGKYQAVELRHRSDGRMFYMGKHSKVTPEGRQTFDYREERWNKFLAEEPSTVAVTEVEFLAEAERHRTEYGGAYL